MAQRLTLGGAGGFMVVRCCWVEVTHGDFDEEKRDLEVRAWHERASLTMMWCF